MTDSKELSGKVAIVTGAGRNIGRAIALQLAQAGAAVVVNARANKTEADSVVAEIEKIGGKAVAVMGDIADEKTAKVMAEAAIKNYGRIDCLINTAALRRENSIDDMDFAEWRECFPCQGRDGDLHHAMTFESEPPADWAQRPIS